MSAVVVVDCLDHTRVRSAGGKRDNAVPSSGVAHSRRNSMPNPDSAAENSKNWFDRLGSNECCNWQGVGH